MNISDTIKAVESIRLPDGKQVQIALDTGEHDYCDLNSNCPIAIQLRRIILDSGITLPQILAANEALMAGLDTRNMVDLGNMRMPAVNGKVKIQIGTHFVELDLTQEITAQLGDRIKGIISEITQERRQTVRLGEQIYSTYLDEIKKARDNKILRQFSAPMIDWIKYGCYSSEENGRYVFIYPTQYAPEYIVDTQIRYELLPADKALLRREAYLKIIVTPQGVVYSVSLLNKDGTLLNHYHGRGNDCWGSVRLQITSFTLRELFRIFKTAMGALATINYNSLMSRDPEGMPNIEDLKRRSIRLGREGMLEVPENIPVEHIPVATPQPAVLARTGWGAGRRT